MFEAEILGASFLAGAVIGRWWSIALAIPASYAASVTYDFEGFSDLGEGVLIGVAVAIGLVAGTATRKIIGVLMRRG